MVYQHGSPFYDEDKEECMKMHRKAFRAFPVSRVYQAHIPTCSSGYWLFGFASKKYHPLNNLRVKEWKKVTYQNKILHNESSPGSLHASEIFRRHARGRGRQVEKYIK